MNLEEKHIDQFDRYFRNEMNGQELLEFERMLEVDADFKQKLEDYRLLTEGIKSYNRSLLKDFLKENAHQLKVERKISPKRYFAIAASLVIVLGIAALIRLSILPVKENNLAIQTEPEPKNETIQKDLSLPPNDSIAVALSDESFNELKAQEKPEVFIDKYVLEEDVPKNTMENVEEKDLVMNGAGKPQMETMDDSKYLVLTDIKLKDTTWTPILIAVNLSDRKETESKVSNEMPEIVMSKKSKILPYNNASNKPAVDAAPSQVFKDTSTAKKTESSKKVAEKKVVNNNQLNVQFWKSPVNYKGYTYNNNSLQLYGLDPANVKLYQYNGQLYLKSQGNVYILAPCSTTCPYKIATDNEILNLLIDK